MIFMNNLQINAKLSSDGSQWVPRSSQNYFPNDIYLIIKSDIVDGASFLLTL